MIRRTRYSIAAVVTLALAACGGHSSDPPDDPVRPETPPHAATPTPPARPAPPTPPVPPTPPGPPTAPGAGFPMHRTTQTVAHGALDFDVVDVPGSHVGDVILARIRATLRGESVDDGNGFAPQRLESGQCSPSFAAAELISYQCELTWRADSRGGLYDFQERPTFNYAIENDQPRDLKIETALAPGMQLSALGEEACKRYAATQHWALQRRTPCIASGTYLSVAPDSLVFAFAPNNCSATAPPPPSEDEADYDDDDPGGGCAPILATLPYAELGALVRADGPLRFVPHATDAAAQVTPLSQQFAPPARGARVAVLGGALPLPDAAILAVRAGTGVLQPRDPVTPLTAASATYVVGVGASYEGAPTAADRARQVGVSVTHVPWTWPQDEVREVVIERSLSLRATPQGRATTTTLPTGTVAVAVTGEVGGTPSEVAIGAWTFVIVDGQTTGWAPSRPLRDGDGSGFRLAEIFRATLPDDRRAELAPRVRTFALGAARSDVDGGDSRIVAHATDAAGTRTTLTLYAGEPYGGRPAPVVLSFDHPGRLTDMRTTQSARGGRVDLLLLAFVVAGDAPGIEHWDAYAVDHGASSTPVLSLTLATGAATARRDRVTLATSVSQGETFAPLVVRVHGTDTRYTWTGASLVTEAAP